MSTPADQPAPSERDPSVAARIELLYEEHSGLVRGICRSLLRDRVETDDAVQQTFLSAQRALSNGSSPRDAAAWLATIARNECLARVRARMREPLPVDVEEHGAGPDAFAVAARRHDAGELRDALADLPGQQREAILLREVRGYSYQEVASALSVTPSAVESLLFRARRSLQVRLQGALAALSPAGWLQPLRELAAKLAGTGVAAPAAVKVAAVGAGAAVMAGGALVGPTVLGLGHAPHPIVRASRPPARHVRPVAAVFSAAPVSLPVHEVSGTQVHQVRRAESHDAVSQPESADSSAGSERSDRQSTSDTQEQAGSTGGDGQAVTDPTEDSSTTSGGSPTTTTGDGSDSSSWGSGTATSPTTTDPTTTTDG